MIHLVFQVYLLTRLIGLIYHLLDVWSIESLLTLALVGPATTGLARTRLEGVCATRSRPLLVWAIVLVSCQYIQNKSF